MPRRIENGIGAPTWQAKRKRHRNKLRTYYSQKHQIRKYLGIHLDNNMSQKTHIRETCRKASKAMMNLSRLTHNINGPTYAKKRMIMASVNSILTYGPPIWHATLNFSHYRNMMDRINRQVALRIISGYRTISTTTALVLAKIPPIATKCKEITTIFTSKDNQLIARQTLFEEWQKNWDQYTGFAKVFIKNLKTWTEQKYTEIDFHLCQALTGHGTFSTYLHKYKKQNTTNCWFCQEIDDPEHTLFHCSRWTYLRIETEIEVGEPITTENISDLLVSSEKNWKAISGMLRTIIQRKSEHEKDVLKR